MTPGRTSGKRGGNYEIDRVIAALGPTARERRLRLSSGTDKVKRFNRINAIIDKLIENDQYEILRGVRDGAILPGQLLEADRKDATRMTLADLQLARSLWDHRQADGAIVLGACSVALAKMKAGPTKARYANSLKALQVKLGDVFGADATVRALLVDRDGSDRDWNALHARWGTSNTDWMHLRKAISRMLSLYLGDKYHPAVRKLRTVMEPKKVRARRPSLTLAQFRAIRAKLPPHADAAVMCMVLTGMRDISEYLACTDAHKNRATRELTVPGTKTEGSDRILQIDPRNWGWIEAGIPARLGYKWLRIYWTRACLAMENPRIATLVPDARRPGKLKYSGLHLHDLRHFHGQWAIDRGIDQVKVQASYGHENPGQTREYLMRTATLEVSSALADALVDEPPPSTLRHA